jgi:DNA-directed RNA polymerase beta' subunit
MNININEKILRFNKSFDKMEVKRFTDWFLRNYGSIRTVELLDKLKSLGFIHATKAGISIGLDDLKIPPAKKSIIINAEKLVKRGNLSILDGRLDSGRLMKKMQKLWYNNNQRLEIEVVRHFRESSLLNPVYMMVFSGARGNLSQVKQLVGMRGFFSDSQGRVIDFPIKSNLKEGLSIVEYFTSCYGARKGIIDTALKTADAGYLTRRLVYVGQSQIIKKPNCFSKQAKLILTLKETKEEYNETKEKLIGRVLAKDIYNIKTNEIIASQGQDICKYLVKKIIQVKKIYIRTPFSCKLNTGLCQLCYGWNLATGRLVDLGESVGILAAQSIGEPGTQLTMRTFHTGGVFSSSRKLKETISSPYTGIVNYNVKEGGKKLKTKYGENIFFTLIEKKIIISLNKIAKATLKLPKHTILYLKPYQRVLKNQIIAESSENDTEYIDEDTEDELTEKIEIKIPLSGLIFSQTQKGVKLNKKNDFKNGKRIWVIIGTILTYNKFLDYLHTSMKNPVKSNFNYNPQKNKKNKININQNVFKIKLSYRNFLKLPNFNQNYQKFNKIRKEYMVMKNKIKTQEIFFTNDNEKWIKITEKNLKPGIKIGELVNKNQALSNTTKNQHRSRIVQIRKDKICVIQIHTFFIDKHLNINCAPNEFIFSNTRLTSDIYTTERADDIVQGLPKVEQILEARKTSNLRKLEFNSHEALAKEFSTLSKKYGNSIAVRKAFEIIQESLVTKVQNVYRAQGVNISDKHLEIIVRQMTSRALIVESGDSNIMTGEVMEVTQIESINKKLKRKIKYEPIVVGISKLSLSNSSFLCEASFQETTRVLARSAIEGKIDWLYGLKENVILGNLIPAGTGYKNL